MSDADLRGFVLEVALEQYRRGCGWANQKDVLHEVIRRMPDAKGCEIAERRILACWHDLFRRGELSWGFDLETPGPPFFHVPKQSAARREALAARLPAGSD